MKNMILKYCVPLIMVFFFARNIILVESDNLDSWMGGGMRMFGKIDKMLYRVSGFEAEHNNETYFVNLKNIEIFKDEDVEIRILPSNKRLKSTMDKIKKQTWCYDEVLNEITINNDTLCNETIDLKQIKAIQVYQIHYDANNQIVKLKLLNDAKN